MAILTVGLLCFAIGLIMGAWLRKLDQRLARIDFMEEEIAELREQLGRRRHTYSTIGGLDDAQAVIVDLMLREELESRYRDARLVQLSEILGIVRKNPQEYDEDRPNNRTSAASQ